MDLVTITDHDSIGGCLEYLDRHPTRGTSSSPRKCRAGCRRATSRSTSASTGSTSGCTASCSRFAATCSRSRHGCARRASSSCSIICSTSTGGQLPLDAYLGFSTRCPALEARNGTMIPAHNALVERIASRRGRRVPIRDGRRQRRAHAAAGRADMDGSSPWSKRWRATISGFLTSLRECRARPAGAHGGTASVAGDAYGVVARYCASLLGAGPRDHRALRRAGCLAFSLVSLPAQFLPLVIVASGKRREAREVRRGRLRAVRPGSTRPAEAIQPAGDRGMSRSGSRSPASASSRASARPARRRGRR